ncbi:MAG TPA: MoxR family ATPase [Candidatus Saccharimonadales bacterium]|nr:MoxR family ATPase [Candidatus Saccharimonadales bacterium]
MEQHNSLKLAQSIAQINPKFEALKHEISKIIVGQESIVMMSCIGLLTHGHILLEGVPGVAKTTLIKTIAQALGVSFSRIQFTPDLLPSDIVGTLVYNPKTLSFDTKKGPIFANLVLADEINRSPAKVQSALLEAMQERQITIGSTTYSLEEPFLVFATQNPIENEGTYQLPEAQVDRFMFKLSVSYPTMEQEREILRRNNKTSPRIFPVLTQQDLTQARDIVSQVYLDDRLIQYILDIIFATRDPLKFGLTQLVSMISCGASPRASIAISQACRAFAFLQGRHYVIPDDIKYVASSVLRHRIILTYQAAAEDVTPDRIIKAILDSVIVP